MASGNSTKRRSSGPQKDHEDSRLDMLCRMVQDFKAGKPKDLTEEIEAMRAFMLQLERDFASSGEHGMAFFIGMVADLVAMVLIKMAFDEVGFPERSLRAEKRIKKGFLPRPRIARKTGRAVAKRRINQ
jgi:hypothetical protein